MRRLIHYSAAHYIPVLVVLVIVTAIMSYHLPALKIDVSPENLMLSDTPEREFYDSILNEYGTDNITVIVIRDQDIQSPKSLEKIKRIVDRLSGLEFVRRVESLFNAKRVYVENDSIHYDPYLKNRGSSAESIAKQFIAAQSNPLVTGNLLSADGNAMAINVYLDDISLDPDQDSYIVKSIDSVLQYYESDFEDLYQIGLPYVRDTLERQVIEDQLVLLPQSLFVLLIVLILMLRHINGGIIPLLTSLTSIVWTLGLMALLNIPLTLVTAIVPMLLIIIGSTEDVHLISEYYLAKRNGKSKHEAVSQMARRKGFASLMTFITTWLGFASIAVNPLDVLREFSIVATSGMLFNYIITMLFVPAWLCLFGSRKLSEPSEDDVSVNAFQPLMTGICYIVHERKVLALITIIIVCLISLYGASKIRLNNNVMAYFDETSIIRMRADDISDNLAGIESFMIVLDAGIEDVFLKEKYLSQVKRLTEYIDGDSGFDKATSFADHISIMNSAVNDSGQIILPEEDNIIDELSLFVNQSDVEKYIDTEFSKTVVHVRHNIGSSYEFNKALSKLESYIDNNIDRAIEVTITGKSILINNAADSMAIAQARSLILIIVIIFIVISLIFVNVQAGLIAVAPNLFPIVVMFGVMGFFGIPLDIGTAMVAAISVGVIIDDTLHLMVRYNQELTDSPDEENAIANTIRAESSPIISTSLALALGFLVMLQSGFLPIVYFGILSALVMVLAMIAEFILTPILLSSVRLVTLWDVLSLPLKDQLMTQCKLFAGMKPWQVRKLILLSRLNKYRAGDVIMREGEPATEMYILLEGAVNICITNDKGEQVIKESPQSGRLFGMLSVGEGEVRKSGAVANEDSTVLVLSWQNIERVARFYPRISSLFFKNLSSIMGGTLVQHIQGNVDTA